MTATLDDPADSVSIAVPSAISRIVGVGTAVTGTTVTQPELLGLLGIDDPRVRSVYLNSAIDTRRLTLPEPDATGLRRPEPQGELLAKHRRLAVEMGSQALQTCLKRAGAALSDLRHLCCVTSTGFLTPGLSALLIKQLGIDPHCSRSDIVGMGCNAGLNALNVVAGWAAAHPGELSVVLCTEACSAAYALDGTMRTSVVNSLFGDGAAAVAVVSDHPGELRPGPQILKFASFLITDAIDAMRYDWDNDLNRFSFFLDPQIPYVVGANAETAIDRLLAGTGLRRSDIAQWLVHSGGKKVIDAVVVNLGLSRHDVRHTTGVLREYGNVSSGSFLFSYERLVEEGVTRPGDYGVLMTMGPGSTIETALVQW
ncbi:3,5-dihydroxyphenylacetyl-CoA synthase DpgA [Micromonospora aurantiaca]|uniref:3,5-dihydroxyphenylacetyl-CoA synthase DpgA n=1 Tax=Micromonospora aurantiaca (nom. illeg.) TaxID=47850 RepID=UPI0033BA37F3